MTRGLVVGKFYPPHLGHSYLINTAVEQSDTVDVLVVDNPRYGIPATTRAAWIQEMHPTVHVHIIDDINDDDNSEHWAKHTIQLLGYAPDVVFTSEAYGDGYAKHLGAKHVSVDPPRTTVPVSGTAIRANTISTRQYQGPPVREALAIRIVVTGAESTGTTTLTKALAAHYGAAWVPEIGRYYTESLLTTKFLWDDADFERIATLQQDYENAIARKAGGLVFCDTNATATTLWQQRYLNHISEATQKTANNDRVDLYIVTGDEIPFEDDGTRDGEHIRHDMHHWFMKLVKESGVPYILVRGDKETRLKKAMDFIDKHLPELQAIRDN